MSAVVWANRTIKFEFIWPHVCEWDTEYVHAEHRGVVVSTYIAIPVHEHSSQVRTSIQKHVAIFTGVVVATAETNIETNFSIYYSASFIIRNGKYTPATTEIVYKSKIRENTYSFKMGTADQS